ncbi:hypothetical protein D3C87_1375380 [compost metagenome]
MRQVAVASLASLVRSTRNMLSSICSMRSPMRSTSRAALDSASVGVGSAAGSRWRGVTWLSPVLRPGRMASQIRASGAVAPSSSTASATLNSRWKLTMSRCGSVLTSASSSSAWFSSGSAITHPSSRDSRLPSVTRLPGWLLPEVVSSAEIPEPRLAPSTSASATWIDTTPADASAPQNSTTARLE